MADARARGCWREWEAKEVRAAEALLTLISMTYTLFSRSTHTPYPVPTGTWHDSARDAARGDPHGLARWRACDRDGRPRAEAAAYSRRVRAQGAVAVRQRSSLVVLQYHGVDTPGRDSPPVTLGHS